MSQPRTHRLLRAASLVLSVLWIGCSGASDGGPIGTGIQASIVGNVLAVTGLEALPGGDAASRADSEDAAQSALPPIEVSIDGRPGVITHTDEAGAFDLSGDVAGDVTLRFTLEGLSVATQLAVPADSVVSLTDIELSSAGVEVQAVRQLDFLGTVTQADCAGSALVVEDLSGAPFEIDLVPETSIETRDGAPAACADLVDASVAIDGLGELSEAGRVVALRIVVAPTQKPLHPEQRSLALVGFAAATHCAADGVTGTIAIEESFSRTRVRILRTTSITRASGAEISCADIRLGDQVGATGILSLKNPGEIRAERLLVSHRPNPDVQLRFLGFLTAVDCTTGGLELLYGGTLTDVILLPTTVVKPELTCDQLQLGDRLSGVGRLGSDGSDAIEATRVKVQRRKSAQE